ncbi:olfactory receptor 10A7-like [Rana temporaria]|uniref:olfactory receptor 10A7-like n=1 Tax=Rana temporaria TaxID=8407 RepID=UPI001AADFD08|nr:olfactory receptor 10A7-like [Rana temporaria]
MCQDNQTQVSEIYLLGFQGLENFKPLFFALLLLIYIAIATGNILIILLVSTNSNLKIPMFVFLQHLALADVLLATCVIPLMAEVILKTKREMSVDGCILQLYSFLNFGFVQCFILAIMSYDRYVAISNPLNYILIMDHRICFLLGLGSWAITWTLSTIEIILVAQFEFCGLRDIDYFFCDVGPIVKLSTSDTSVLQWFDLTCSILFFFGALTFIIGTYIYIFIIILKISSSAGRKKAFSTCSAHLISVAAYYGSIITIYVTPDDEKSPSVNKYSSLLYTVVNPLVNPIIYSLRNHEIRQALHKIVQERLRRKVI